MSWIFFAANSDFVYLSVLFMLSVSVSKYILLTLPLLTWRIWWVPNEASRWQMGFNLAFNPLNAELNPICPLLALFVAHHILHVSMWRVKGVKTAALRGGLLNYNQKIEQLFYTEVNRSHFLRIAQKLSAAVREKSFEDVWTSTGWWSLKNTWKTV